MSVLSEFDIYRELGEGILIYPFSIDKMKGGCLRLTASEQAYKPSSGDPVKILEEKARDSQGNILKDANGKDIIKRTYFSIEPHETIAVWTNESVFIGEKFCGSIHSRVRLVSQGIGHIGTKVDPSWCGILAIALHNTSNQDLQIEINETIAYLRFHRFNSSSSYKLPRREGTGKLQDVFGSLTPPKQLTDWLEDSQNKWRNGEEQHFRDFLLDIKKNNPRKETYYKKAKAEINKGKLGYKFFEFINDNIYSKIDTRGWTALSFLVALIALFVGLLPKIPENPKTSQPNNLPAETSKATPIKENKNK